MCVQVHVHCRYHIVGNLWGANFSGQSCSHKTPYAPANPPPPPPPQVLLYHMHTYNHTLQGYGQRLHIYTAAVVAKTTIKVPLHLNIFPTALQISVSFWGCGVWGDRLIKYLVTLCSSPITTTFFLCNSLYTHHQLIVVAAKFIALVA